jgi:hypothetical protein
MNKRRNDRARELCQNLIAVVADLAFVDLVRDQQADQNGYDGYWKMMLEVHQPLEGEILLAMEPALLREITNNIYGFDEEQLTREHELDTLAELLNTISGRFMQVIVPPTTGYTLGLPFFVENYALPVNEGSVSFAFHSDEGRLILSLLGRKLIDEVIT